jgi:hypothetical protein
MPNAFFAEWLIARFIDPSRAAAVVGDLLEVGSEQGPVWFWSSVAGVVLSLTWRRLVAFTTAYLCLSLLDALSMAYLRLRGAHPPPHAWAPIFAFVGMLGWVSSAAAPYAVIRYGFRDEFTRLLLALLSLFTTLIFCWRIPVVAFTVSIVFTAVVIAFFVSRRRRKTLLAAILALGAGYCGWQLIWYLWPWYLHLVPLSARGYSLSTGALPLLFVAIQAAACGWMHQLLLRGDQRGPETQPGS